MDARNDEPRWGLGEGITLLCQDDVVTVMHNCSHGEFVSEAAEKLSETCGSCKAPLQAASFALLVMESHERVVSPIDYHGRLFVAANHWPRAWYHRALENPDVSVTRNGETTDYRAVPVSEEERERLLDESGFPLVAYVFTGFAPRQFLRLDPR